MTVSARAEVWAILDDRSFEVPTAPAAETGTAWLRATASRFTNGEAHERRRALVERALDDLVPVELRRMAERLANSTESRDVPLAALCLSFGVDRDALPQAVADARLVAAAYPLESGDSQEADAALGRLLELLGPVADEPAAARIALLAQAGTATGVLIDRALERRRNDPSRTVEQVIDETLSSASPVTMTRRVRDGKTVVLDLAVAQLPFGAGFRACPGREQAMALASGVLDAAARGFA